MPSLIDYIEQWNHPHPEITENVRTLFMWGISRKDETVVKYEYREYTLEEFNLLSEEDYIQKRVLISFMLELMPVSSYDELFNTIKDMFYFYNDLDRFALPPGTEKNIIPARVVKHSESKPFEIEE